MTPHVALSTQYGMFDTTYLRSARNIYREKGLFYGLTS